MKAIIITGTPSAGKTTLAKRMEKELHYKRIDANRIIKDNKLYESYDKKKKCYVVDEKKFARCLEKMINGSKERLVIDSHMAHYINPRYVGLCIATKCGLKQLKKRLQGKKYPKSKVEENIECEIMDICLNEAREIGHKVLVIDATKRISIKKLEKKIKKYRITGRLQSGC